MDHHASSASIAQAAALIAAGELVGFPTETVYGLGADASSDAAVAKIFAAKGRPSDHPLIVHVSDASQVDAFASTVPDFAMRLIDAFWPGPLTVILPRKPHVASASAGGQDSIGLRCPSHSMAQSLLLECHKLGVLGVSAPSANRFGRVSPTSAAHVLEEFGASLFILDGGDCDVGIESTIVDCTRGVPVLLRPGVLTPQQMEAVCGERIYSVQDAPTTSGAAPKASGTLESHYAPTAKVRMMRRSALQTIPPDVRTYELPANPEAAAHELFSQLRALDQRGVREIWVTMPPWGEAWDGVRDRLARAAA
jgi:L-threonylcarbamoyladenylate synthase